MNSQELLDNIHFAFPLAPLPEMTLHQGQLADASIRRTISESEWRQAASRNAGSTWAVVSDSTLIECSCALSHLDEQSFIYYLPAFLAFAIRHVDTSFLTPEQYLVGSILFAVTDRSALSLSRYALLTPLQREAVVSFLQFMQQSEPHGQDAQKALERFWLKRPQPLIQRA
jgi:hypothetical protein